MKTAVEWLFEQLDISQGYESAIKILEQAKEMEKEQMESAYLAGESKDKQYYNETFKSEQNELRKH